NPIGPAQIGWGMAKFAGLMVAYLVVAYCCLLTISTAEYGAGPPAPTVGRYVAAGLAACGAAILLGFALYALMPDLGLQPVGLPLVLDTRQLLYSIVWLVANFGLIGGL